MWPRREDYNTLRGCHSAADSAASHPPGSCRGRYQTDRQPRAFVVDRHMPRVARRARGHRRRTIAHRPGHRDQARPPRDSWPFRRDPAVFVPWADVEQIVIYPRPGYRQAARPSASGSSAARAPRTSTRATNQHPAAARRHAWPPGQPGRSPAGGLTATAWPPPPPRSHQAFPSSTPTLALTRALKGQQLVSPIRWERFYIPEGAGRCQAANVPVFVAFPGRVLGTPGGGPGSRWSARLDERPGGRSCSRLTLDQAGNGYGVCGWCGPVRRSCPWQARGCVHPFGCARGWLPRGHGAGSRAGSGINQTGGRPPAGGGQ